MATDWLIYLFFHVMLIRNAHRDRRHIKCHALCEILYYIILTHSMEESSSWETNLSSASQEIPHILLNPKVHYRLHKYSSPVRILSQINPLHEPHPTSWRSILILFSHLLLDLPKRSLYLRFPHQNPTCTSPLPHTYCMPRPSHSFYIITNTNISTVRNFDIIWGKYKGR